VTARPQFFHSMFSFHALVRHTYTGTTPNIFVLAELTLVVGPFSRPFNGLRQVRNAVSTTLKFPLTRQLIQGGLEDSKVALNLVVAPPYPARGPLEPSGLSGWRLPPEKAYHFPPQRPLSGTWNGINCNSSHPPRSRTTMEALRVVPPNGVYQAPPRSPMPKPQPQAHIADGDIVAVAAEQSGDPQGVLGTPPPPAALKLR